MNKIQTTKANTTLRRFFDRLGGGNVKALGYNKTASVDGNGGGGSSEDSAAVILETKSLIERTFGFDKDENILEISALPQYDIDGYTVIGNPETAEYFIVNDDKQTVAFLTEEELDAVSDITNFGMCLFNWVDLGFDSGTLWADRNIGARYEEDFGYYFMAYIINPFRGQGSDAEYSSTIINYLRGDVILPENMKYLGIIGSPSLAACQELVANTTQTPESINGVDGMRFTSNKNQNSIFIPLSGYWNSSGDEYQSEETHLMVSKEGTYQTVMQSYLDGETHTPFSVQQNYDYWDSGLCIRPCIEGNLLV